MHYTLQINDLQLNLLILITLIHGSQKRNYSTSSKKISEDNDTINNPSYFAEVYEKDNGLPTNNVHLKAQRHISSGNRLYY